MLARKTLMGVFLILTNGLYDRKDWNDSTRLNTTRARHVKVDYQTLSIRSMVCHDKHIIRVSADRRLEIVIAGGMYASSVACQVELRYMGDVARGPIAW